MFSMWTPVGIVRIHFPVLLDDLVDAVCMVSLACSFNPSGKAPLLSPVQLRSTWDAWGPLTAHCGSLGRDEVGGLMWITLSWLASVWLGHDKLSLYPPTVPKEPSRACESYNEERYIVPCSINVFTNGQFLPPRWRGRMNRTLSSKVCFLV